MSKSKTEIAGPIEVKAMVIADRMCDAGLGALNRDIRDLAKLFARELDKINIILNKIKIYLPED